MSQDKRSLFVISRENGGGNICYAPRFIDHDSRKMSNYSNIVFTSNGSRGMSHLSQALGHSADPVLDSIHLRRAEMIRMFMASDFGAHTHMTQSSVQKLVP